MSPLTAQKGFLSYLSVSIGIDLLSDGDSVSTNVNVFKNLGTHVKTCLIYGAFRHGALRRCLKTLSEDAVVRESLQTVS